MKVLIVGSGLIGPTAAYYMLHYPEVDQLVICDIDQSNLDLARQKLSSSVQIEKLSFVNKDITNSSEDLLADCDLVVSAVPRAISHKVICSSVACRKPVVELTLPLDTEMAKLQNDLSDSDVPIILGAGLEPGLTEIMARHAARGFEQIDELHIKVGGIPEIPASPLGYKIVYGGTSLPLSEASASMVEDEKLIEVERYTGVEEVIFSGIGRCEAHLEMFMPWILDLPEFKNLKHGTQKTIRWPGFAEKALLLKHLGLLSQKPVEMSGESITPKDFLDRLFYPLVKLEEGERDLSLFRVEVTGLKEGKPTKCKIEMIDHFDDHLGFTSMSRTVGCTGAIISHLVLCGKVKEAGIIRPEQVITGELLTQLFSELEQVGIKFSEVLKA